MTNEITKTGEQRLEALLEKDSIKARFAKSLNENAEAFISSILTVYRGSDQLQRCEPMSIISAAHTAASLDLPIHPSLGMAHIVPYGTVATFQCGWKGLVQLAQRTELYEAMNATPIYEGQLVSEDQFTGDYAFQPEKKSDTIIGYLFYFRLIGGFRKYTYWPVEKVKKHAKRYAKSYESEKGRWKLDFDAMALKTVVIDGLSKWGPKSIKMKSIQRALVSDNAVIDPETGEVKERPDAIDVEVEEAKPQSSRLEKLVTDGTKTVITESDRLVNDYKTAIDGATTEEEISRLDNEAAASTLPTEAKSLIHTHCKMTKKKLQG
jgi:recombination protein RecT